MVKRILVADDDKLIRQVIGELLSRTGYVVAEAANGKEVMAHVNLAPPDLIILDLAMPSVDGFQVLAWLKADELTRFIPIIVITGQEGRSERVRSLELGADDFLMKPVEHTELLARVHSLLRFKGLNDQLLHSYRQISELGRIAEDLLQARDPMSHLSEAVLGSLLREEVSESLRPSRLWTGRRSGERLGGVTFRLDDGSVHKESSHISLDTVESWLSGASREGDLFWVNGPLPGPISRLFGAGGALASIVGVTREANWFMASGYNHAVNAYDGQVLRTIALQWQFFDRITGEMRATEDAFFYMMSALARAAELNDQETGNHIMRVNAQSALLADKLGCSHEFVRWIGQSAQMHDVGKMSIPRSVLRKPGPLDKDEWAWIHRHPLYGAQILGESPRLSMAREIALAHHENWDGSGYPTGLASTKIPLSARIVKIVDVYDALRSTRPYKRALTHEEAVAIISQGDNRVLPTHFDPEILSCFVHTESNVHEIHRAYADTESSPGDEHTPPPHPFVRH